MQSWLTLARQRAYFNLCAFFTHFFFVVTSSKWNFRHKGRPQKAQQKKWVCDWGMAGDRASGFCINDVDGYHHRESPKNQGDTSDFREWLVTFSVISGAAVAAVHHGYKWKMTEWHDPDKMACNSLYLSSGLLLRVAPAAAGYVHCLWCRCNARHCRHYTRHCRLRLGRNVFAHPYYNSKN